MMCPFKLVETKAGSSDCEGKNCAWYYADGNECAAVAIPRLISESSRG